MELIAAVAAELVLQAVLPTAKKEALSFRDKLANSFGKIEKMMVGARDLFAAAAADDGSQSFAPQPIQRRCGDVVIAAAAADSGALVPPPPRGSLMSGA